MKILIVEDEAVIAMVLKSRIKNIGHTIVGPVSTGENAIKTAAEEKPDLIIMDINLGGKIDGIEAAETINRQYSVPIIFTTGYNSEDLKGRAMQIEPLAYIIKPAEPDAITQIITQHFSN